MTNTTTKPKKAPDKVFYFPQEKLKEILISHLYATSFLNDDEEVVTLNFKSGVDIKNKIQVEMFLKKLPKIQNEQLEFTLDE
jgi:hypothetical protein